MRFRRAALSLGPTIIMALLPLVAHAQMLVNDTRRSTELAIVHEWFHRELEPAPYGDTQWNITSLQLSYSVTDWFKFAFQGGYSVFEAEDFADARYKQYSVGGGIAVRALKRETWDIEATARYLDTFDLDTSLTLFHKHVRSANGSFQLVHSFSPFEQSVKLWAGPLIVDDFVESFAWDTTAPVSSSDGLGWGAQAGTRIVMGGFVALYGFVSYVDDVQGGIALSLHAGNGGF